MSAAIVYLGDELSAAGFRLAGVDVRVPAAGAERECLAAAMREASVVLLAPMLIVRSTNHSSPGLALQPRTVCAYEGSL